MVRISAVISNSSGVAWATVLEEEPMVKQMGSWLSASKEKKVCSCLVAAAFGSFFRRTVWRLL